LQTSDRGARGAGRTVGEQGPPAGAQLVRGRPDLPGLPRVAGLHRLHRRHRAGRSQAGITDQPQDNAQQPRTGKHGRGMLCVEQ